MNRFSFSPCAFQSLSKLTVKSFIFDMFVLLFSALRYRRAQTRVQVCRWSKKDKCKAVPYQARCCPDGSSRFRLPDFMTCGTWRWWGCHPHALAHFTSRKRSWYSFSLWLSRPQGHGTVGRHMSLKNPVTPPGIYPGTVRPVAQRLNHCATADPSAGEVSDLNHQWNGSTSFNLLGGQGVHQLRNTVENYAPTSSCCGNKTAGWDVEESGFDCR
jgi:hypothetical protein